MIAVLMLSTVIIGYLLGSIPWGVLIGQKFANTDIRDVGSGKTGTTNVLRTAGRKAAALALILDIAKGAAAVTVAWAIFRSNYSVSIGGTEWRATAQALAASFTIIGHSWSVFLKFKGGRGVATFIGALLALYWPAGVIGSVFIIGIGFRTKYMSLGSIIGGVTAFIMLMSFYILRIDFPSPHPPFEYVIFAMAGAIFIYVMHRDNIIRLFNGTERKLGEKIKVEPSTPSHNTK
jgi:glycerol-3-phosphate acyltransferase PlsY